MAKRLADITLAVVLAILFCPIILVLAALILITDGRPIFYTSERMKSVEAGFVLWKFRTMRVVQEDTGVTGADKSDRITLIGRFLRSSRLDELPQLWNILRGDMSFVGPRPPLRMYVELRPDLYGQVLKSRPGLTGLATLLFHRREQNLLAECSSAAQTHAVYMQRCVPTKARLDLIYARHTSVCFDALILWRTFTDRLSKA